MTPFSEAQHARSPSRIILARDLAGYAPFTLDVLEDCHALAATGTPGPDRGATRAPQFVAPQFVPLDTRLQPANPAQAGDRGRPRDEAKGQAAGARQPDGYQAAYEAGRQTGRNEGFELGFQAATEQADRERQERGQLAGAALAEQLTTLSTTLAERFASLEAESADAVVELALAVARQALRTSLVMQPEAIVEVVREALAGLHDERPPVRLWLNPDDVALVRDSLAEPLQTPGCEIVADTAIERGGCRVETTHIEIDALVETRWRRTLAALGR